MLFVKKTSLPDVFELYKTVADMGRRDYMEACVPSMQVSKHLRALFINLGVTDTVAMVCQMHPKFRKWVPLRVAE